MSNEEEARKLLDTSDVDRWVGVPLGGAWLKDPIVPNDIRRWVQGHQNPNPLFFDEQYAAESRFGRMVAPYSFTVCTDDSHGAAPATQGHIEGTHMLFGGDEWWFYGPRISPGDTMRQERMLFDYKLTMTRFAGPTMFSRGDTTYINGTGETCAKQRSTSIRYRAADAVEKAQFADAVEKEWSDEELEQLHKQKFDYYQSFLDLGHDRRLFAEKGEKLPRRVIGPHTLLTFTTEWRSFLMSIWGSFRDTGLPSSLRQAGWIPEMSRDTESARIDPSEADGLYKGASRGHAQPRYARLIGMPRGYGYGASMGAWLLDYLSNWGGEWTDLLHSKMTYRSPALTGDVTYIDGEVIDISHDHPSGRPQVQLRVQMTNQRDEEMAFGTAEMLLPTETDPAPAERESA
jgi:acyl dehydratase